MRAAIAAVRRRGAAAVVVAAPVGAAQTCRAIADEADDVVCLLRPEALEAVGLWYEDFAQVDDADVCRLLRRASPGSDTPARRSPPSDPNPQVSRARPRTS